MPKRWENKRKLVKDHFGHSHRTFPILHGVDEDHVLRATNKLSYKREGYTRKSMLVVRGHAFPKVKSYKWPQPPGGMLICMSCPGFKG